MTNTFASQYGTTMHPTTACSSLCYYGLIIKPPVTTVPCYINYLLALSHTVEPELLTEIFRNGRKCLMLTKILVIYLDLLLLSYLCEFVCLQFSYSSSCIY